MAEPDHPPAQDPRPALREQAAERRREAARLLLEGDDLEAAKRRLEWAHTAEQLLAAEDCAAAGEDAARRRLAVVGFIALVCLSLVLLAWTLHPRNNALRLEVEARAIQLRLERDWDLAAPLSPTGLGVERLRELYVPQRGTLDLDGFGLGGDPGGAGFDLSGLHLPAGSLLDLEAGVGIGAGVGTGGVTLFLHDGALRGEVTVRAGRLQLPGLDAPIPIGGGPGMPPTRLTFAGAAVGPLGVPTRLDLDIPPGWRLTGLRATALGFDREQPPGSGERVSTLRRASGTFTETGRTFEVEAGDWLFLDGVEAPRLRIEGGKEALTLVMQGRVDRVRGGPEGFVRNRTPSWLEYLVERESVALLWGALMFLWGLAWKLRGLL